MHDSIIPQTGFNPTLIISGNYRNESININHVPGIYAISGLAPSSLKLPIYIGSAADINRRINKHISALEREKHHNCLLQKYYNLHGINSLVFFVFELCSKDNLLNIEQKYIDSYGTCKDKSSFNISPTAGNTLGFNHSQKSKEMMSLKHKGKFVSEETRKKQSLIGKGRKHTEESRRKMSIVQTGISKPCKNPEARAKEFKLIDPNGNLFIGKNLKKFCRDNNLSQANMHGVLKGRVKSCKGWTSPFFKEKWKKRGDVYKFIDHNGKIFEGNSIKGFIKTMNYTQYEYSKFLQLKNGKISEFEGWKSL